MDKMVSYQLDNGSEVFVRLTRNSLWLTKPQLSDLLHPSIANISLHLNNIYADDELVEADTTEDFSVIQLEEQLSVSMKIKHYNLDAIIAVAYRVNCKRGTQFRQWATPILQDHLKQEWVLAQLSATPWH